MVLCDFHVENRRRAGKKATLRRTPRRGSDCRGHPEISLKNFGSINLIGAVEPRGPPLRRRKPV